jgi:hypothetical protein
MLNLKSIVYHDYKYKACNVTCCLAMSLRTWLPNLFTLTFHCKAHQAGHQMYKVVRLSSRTVYILRKPHLKLDIYFNILQNNLLQMSLAFELIHNIVGNTFWTHFHVMTTIPCLHFIKYPSCSSSLRFSLWALNTACHSKTHVRERALSLEVCSVD